ncbi:MAG: class I SAM-dependent methyltransferase, partial [Acidobacteriaceae bacterium]
MIPTSLPVDSTAAAEQALLRHPGVSAATVFTHGDRLLALVVPAEAWLDESLDRRAAAAAALRKWQKTYDLNQSSKAAAAAPPGFNTIGWDSSYTRGPLPVDDMREWVRTSVDSILRLGAHSIYEIGCGTGMLLLRIAPLCERYVAVDFSHEVLARVREQLQSMPAVAARVELMERPADNFAGLEPRSFDAVVINSAVQYFPNAEYLAQVLENAIGLVGDGGHVFIGDVRSLPLLPAFAASVELFQAADDLPMEELRGRLRRRLRHAPELVLSPAWFLALGHRLARVAHVAIALRRGRGDNEMTRYRYDAIFRVGPARPPAAITLEPASADPITQIRHRLQGSGEAFGIGGIPNARIEKDRIAHAAIAAADPGTTAGQLRHQIEEVSLHGVHPQDLFDLEAVHPGLQVHLSWAAARSDGSYDALLVPGDAEPDAAFALPEPRPSAFLHTASTPGQAAVRTVLVERLLDHCREHLPQSAVPDGI